MKTYIVLSFPDIDRIEPTLPFVSELTRRGHIVIYYTADAFQSTVERYGAEFRNYPIEIKDILKLNRERQVTKDFKIKYKLVETCLVEEMKNEQPAGILYDSELFFAKLIGKKIKIPTISLVTNLVDFNNENEYYMPKTTSFKNILSYFRDKKIKTPLEEVSGHLKYSDLNFVYTFMDFQPYATLLDSSFQFVGYPLAESKEDVLTLKLPEVVLYLAFSPEFSYLHEVINILKNMFCDGEVAVIVKSHLKLDPRLLPLNFKMITEELSPSDFSKLSCMITDGGVKRTHQCLKYKLPMLTIPNTMDQHRLGRRIEECMIGLTVESIQKEIIEDRLECLLSDPKFVANAKLIGSRFQVLSHVGKMVYEMEQYIEKNQKKR